IEGAKFINAKPVYFPPMERKWGNDNLKGVAWKAAAIHDKDGSVGGVPNSYILLNDGPNDSIATDATACEIKPTWNAVVCKGDIGRLSFGGGGGGPGRGGRPARGGAAAPGAVAGGQGAPGAAPEGAGARGAAAGRGGPPARGAGAAAQPPVVLSRNGREYPQPASNVRAGTEIK